MVSVPKRLSARDDDDSSSSGSQGVWGPMQIATPAIVGGVLLLFIAAYLIWQRKRTRNRPYDYHPVRSDWVSKIGRMFVPRRIRQRVLHSSAPMTLDDSMRLSGVSLDFRRSRQLRSDSSDSQTPLTSAGYPVFDYPRVPRSKLSDSPPPISKRRGVRWWWLFGSRPKEIKSSEPGTRWRVDGPDGSNSGHGHEDYRPRYIRDLEPMHEDPEETGVRTTPRIVGGTLASVGSTPMVQRPPERTRPIRGTTTPIPHESRTPVPAATALLQTAPGTLGSMSSANRGLPPSYDASQSQTLAHYPSAEEIVRLARGVSGNAGAPVIIPTPVPVSLRTAVYSPSPHGFHGRELSSDSFLAAQPPMTVATSLY